MESVNVPKGNLSFGKLVLSICIHISLQLQCIVHFRLFNTTESDERRESLFMENADKEHRDFYKKCRRTVQRRRHQSLDMDFAEKKHRAFYRRMQCEWFGDQDR